MAVNVWEKMCTGVANFDNLCLWLVLFCVREICLTQKPLPLSSVEIIIFFQPTHTNTHTPSPTQPLSPSLFLSLSLSYTMQSLVVLLLLTTSISAHSPGRVGESRGTREYSYMYVITTFMWARARLFLLDSTYTISPSPSDSIIYCLPFILPTLLLLQLWRVGLQHR